MKRILLFIFLSSALLASSQLNETNKVMNPRALNKMGYGIQLFGPAPFASVYVNYFVNQNVNIEGAIGLLGAYGGVYYMVGRKDKKNLISPYLGADVGVMRLPNFNFGFYGGNSEFWANFITSYFSAGLQLMTQRGFHLSIEGAVFALKGFNSNVIPWGALKIGQNF
jgi:hypothetical protein